jgi:glycosyltransferase involved in cell wall biosynthesis
MSGLRLTLSGPVILRDGYGAITCNLAKEFLALGVDLELRSTTSLDPTDLYPELIQVLNTKRRNDCELLLGLPVEARLMQSPFKLMFSMFEAPGIPRSWVDWLSSATINIVPSQWGKQIWQDAGVEDPIEVVPLGINPEIYEYRPRPLKDHYTFLISGTLQRRKNPLMVAQAFLEEFKNAPDVRLVIKSLSHLPVSMSVPDPRITIINDSWSTDRMLELMYGCDCFVYPSSGEGFGLPPLEAMATGMPTILSSCTGMLEFCHDQYCLPLPMFGEETNATCRWNEGYMPVPCYRTLRALMRFMYQEREYGATLGESASSWVRTNFTWRRTASSLLRIINDSGIIVSN